MREQSKSRNIQKALPHRGKQVLQLAYCGPGVRAVTSVGESWTGVQASLSRMGGGICTKSRDPQKMTFLVGELGKKTTHTMAELLFMIPSDRRYMSSIISKLGEEKLQRKRKTSNTKNLNKSRKKY